MAAHGFPINLPAMVQWRDNDHGKSYTLGTLGDANTTCPLTIQLDFMNGHREGPVMKLSFTPLTANIDGSFTRDAGTTIPLIYGTEHVLRCSDVIHPGRLTDFPWEIRSEVRRMRNSAKGRDYSLISLDISVKKQPIVLMPRAPKHPVDEHELKQVLLLKNLSRAKRFSLFMSLNGSDEEICHFKDSLQFGSGGNSALMFDSDSHATVQSPNDGDWNCIYIKAAGGSIVTLSDLERLQIKLPGASTFRLRGEGQLRIENQNFALDYDDPIEQKRSESPPEREKTSEQRTASLRKKVQEQTGSLKPDKDQVSMKNDQEYMPQPKEETEAMQQEVIERPKKRVRFADEFDDSRTLADDFLNQLGQEISMSASPSQGMIQRDMTDNVMEQQPESGAEVKDNTAPQTTAHGTTVTAILNAPAPELAQAPTPDSSLGLRARWRRWAGWVIMQPQTEPAVIGSLLREAYQAATGDDAEGFVGKILSILESLGNTGGGGDDPV